MSREIHTIPPVFDSHSKILILGSFPSVKSRESQFFYGHPQNRFWGVLAAVPGQPLPSDIAEKKEFLLRNHIALWDVIESCEITGSSDSSIRNAVPNNLNRILCAAPVCQIFTNGRTAGRLYDKYCLNDTGRPALCLPSTSPANAAWSLDRLVTAWNAVRTALQDA